MSDIAKQQAQNIYGDGAALIQALIDSTNPNALADNAQASQNQAIADIVAAEQKKGTGFTGFDSGETNRYFKANSAIPDLRNAGQNAISQLTAALNNLSAAQGTTRYNLADTAKQQKIDAGLQRSQLALQLESAQRAAARRAAAAAEAAARKAERDKLKPKEEASIMAKTLYQQALDDGYIKQDEVDALYKTIQQAYGSSLSTKDLKSVMDSYFPEGWADRAGIAHVPSSAGLEGKDYEDWLGEWGRYWVPAPVLLPGDPGYGVKPGEDTRSLMGKVWDQLNIFDKGRTYKNPGR